MATDIAIASLPNLPAGQVSDGDIVPIVDISDLTDPGGTTKGTLASALTQYTNRHNGVFNVQDPTYGAVGNGIADDTAAIQATVTAAAAVTSNTGATFGAIVYFPAGTYFITAQITIPQGVALLGAGARASSILSSFSGYALYFGGTGGGLTYGCGIESLSINMTNTTGGAFQAAGTSGFYARDLYIQGVVSGLSTGFFIDGSNAANIFTKIDNVIVNHCKFGAIFGTTGSSYVTTVDAVGLRVLCDTVSGSVGVTITPGVTYGIRLVGGNIEACAIGIQCYGQMNYFTTRFEGCTVDIQLENGAKGNYFAGCSGISNVNNFSNNTTNTFISNTDGAATPFPANTLVGLSVSPGAGILTPGVDLLAGANVVFEPNTTPSDARNILVDSDNTYTGNLFLQPGSRSAAFGGSLTLYGHANATHPGDVVAGISSGSGGKFRVNSQALDGGSDYLQVGSTGAKVLTGFGCNGATPQTAFASGGAAPAGGTGTAAGGWDTSAHRDAAITLLNNIRTALINAGLMT